MKVICPYCSGNAALEDSKKVYGRSFGMMWICENYPVCDSYVGVDKRDNKTPHGSLANKELRELRKVCHNDYFDPLWKSGKMERSEAYKSLQLMMGLSKDDCHIGKFNIDQCKLLIQKLSK